MIAHLLVPLQEKQAVSEKVALRASLGHPLLAELHEISCDPRNFSYSQVAAAGEKRARISPQSDPGDLASRVLLSHAVTIIVIFLSKFRQMNQLVNND